MTKLRGPVVLSAVVTMLALAAAASAVDITVDDSVAYQTITGFGSCTAGWISSVGTDTRTHEAYWEDLGASIFRINMTPAALNLDACNETTTYLGSDIDENIALFNWDTNSKGDPNPFGAMAAAAATRAIDDYTIAGAIWSPPDYMKTGQTCCQVNESCGGHLIQTSDNLTQFGRYVAAYVKGWSNYWGVDLEWVSPQNEPGMGANYSSCVYDTEASGGTAELPPAIQAARDELDANGLTWCKLTAPDGPWYVSCWDHVQDFFYYVRDIRDYSLADLGGWSIHMNNWVDARQAWDIIWNGGIDPEHTSRSFTGLKTDGLSYMWMTEVCEEPCDLSGALKVAENIHNALAWGNCDAFIYWTLTFGGACEWQTLCDWIDGEGPNTSALKYCAAKHYFRMIRPGAVRVAATPMEYDTTTNYLGGPEDGLCTTAYKHSTNGTLTIVITNLNNTAYTADITVNTSLAIDSYSARRTSSSERWAVVGPYYPSGGVISVPVPAQSIITLWGGGEVTPPAAPTGLTATAVNEHQIDLDWDDSTESDLDSYRVYRSTSSGGPYDPVASGLTSSAYSDTGVSASTTYYYVVTAVDTSLSESDNSSEASATTPSDTTAPAPPTNLTATAVSSSQIDLDWDDNSEGDLDSYIVYRSTTSGSGYAEVGTVYGASDYSDPGLTAGTTYYYVVTALDTAANESGYSNEASATPQAALADADIVGAASAPSIDGSVDGVWSSANAYSIANTLSGSTGGSDLSGSWRAMWDSANLYYLVEVTDESLQNDSTNAWEDDSVEVYIDADNSKGTSYDGVNDYQLMFRWNDSSIHLGANSAGDTTGMQFAIADTANGYTVEVLVPWSTLGVTPSAGSLIGTDVHVNDDDDGSGRDGKIAWFATTDDSWSNPSLFAEAELLAGGGDTTPPAAPTGLSAAAVSDGQIDLDWDDNVEGDLDSYNVYRDGGQIATGVGSSSYSDTGLSASTQYCYTVTAVDTSANESAESNQSCAATQADATPPAAPTNLSATAGDGQVSLDWDDNAEPDLDSYNVYRSTTSGSGYGSIATVYGASDYTDSSVTNGTTYYYVVTAVDTSDNESGYSNEASATPQSTGQSPYGGAAWAVPGTIEAEDYDEGGEGVAYHDADSGNNGGAYRSEDVDIESCSDTGGGYNVGWMAADEWLEYTVDVSSGGTYDIEVRVASESAGGNLHIEFGGVDKTGTLSFGATGGWQTWTSVYANDVSLDAGQQVMRIYMESELFNVNKVIITGAGGDTTPPAAPTGLVATAVSDAQIDLDWADNTEPDLDSYNVYRGGSQIATDVTSSSYSDTGLSASTQYCYTVTAVDTSANESAESAQDCATTQATPDTTPPADPAGLAATAGDGQVGLDWDDNTEPDLDSYNVYRSTTSGSGYSSIATGVATSDYTDSGVSNDTTYYYVVTAVDTSANESGYSNEASATPADTTAPAAPTNLSATAGDGSVSLSWDDNTEGDLAGYSVYRSTTSGSGYSSVATGIASSAYTDNNVTNGTTYYYVVTAVDTSDNESGYSNEASATPQASAADATIAQASTAPTIDGSVDSVWSDTNSYSMTNVIQGSVSGDSDLSGTWRALWDSTNLYYLVEVTDESLQNDSAQTYQDDSVEVYIDADNSKGSSYDGVNDYQLMLGWNDSAITVGSQSATDTTGTDFAIAETANGYTCELLVPWSTLGVTPSAGNLIGTDVHVNDDDDGGNRDGKRAWFATVDDSWKNPSLFAEAELLAGEPDTTPPAAPTGLTATAVSSSQIDLDWDDNSEPDLDGYNVYRDSVQIATGVASSSYSDTGLSPETQYCYTVTAADTSANESAGSAQDCATTQSAGGQSPYGGTAWAIPGTIQAEDYDVGGEDVAYHDTSSGNSGGQYRSDDVDIEVCQDTGGGYNITSVVKDEWLEYTVDVASTDTYDIEIRVATQDSGRKVRIEFDGVDKTGNMMYGPTGGMQSWETITKTGVSLDAGQHVMRLYLVEWTQNINWISITQQ